MKKFQNIAFCLSLVFSALMSGAAKAEDTVLFTVFSLSLQGGGGFGPPPQGDIVYGGMIFRHVQYDPSHFTASVAAAFRITPNGTGGITGVEVDRDEIVLRFSRAGTAYAECTMRRVFNDDFDHFVSVQLAVHSPGSNAAENIILPIETPTPGDSRSFVSDSVSYGTNTDITKYYYTANEGICNTNPAFNITGSAVVGGIPNIQAGDTVDVYLINMNFSLQPVRVATGTLSNSDI
jgi:hypothetical protein